MTIEGACGGVVTCSFEGAASCIPCTVDSKGLISESPEGGSWANAKASITIREQPAPGRAANEVAIDRSCRIVFTEPPALLEALKASRWWRITLGGRSGYFGISGMSDREAQLDYQPTNGFEENSFLPIL